MTGIRRRDLLTGTALVLVGEKLASAEVISGKFPWHPDETAAPEAAKAGPWKFFKGDEAAVIEAAVDRLIPTDPETPGGKDAGCAVFIDRQLAGGYGHQQGLYTQGPFEQGTKQQGPQSQGGPDTLYREGIAALDRYCRAQPDGKSFAELPVERQDEVLHGLESGTAKLEGADGKKFFEQLLKDTQQGFFADPLYGGNRDMCAWKMIGFPGAVYDYREWIGRHNERYPHPPISILARRNEKPR